MVQPGLLATRILESLPPRPPTPPRESDHTSTHFEPSTLRKAFFDAIEEHLPPQNSPHSNDHQQALDKSHKRVAWSSRTEYKDPPLKGLTPHSTLRRVPSSGELRPAKSILKPYNGINAVDRRSSGSKLAAPHTYPDFATMLESIVKQLAGEDRSSRIDAYLTLSGVLKASDNVPDPKALKEKIGLLTQFIQRDISTKTASGTFDTVVINNALILLAVLVWKPMAADCIGTDSCIYFVEHSISAFKEPVVPKDVLKHLLFIMAQQNFSSKIMNTDRVRRLIEALGELDKHVKGISIVLGRLSIYRKLLKQSRMSMLTCLDWVEHLFTDMISGRKEVRSPAVAFGLEAALLLGAEKQASRAVMDLFSAQHEEENYGDYYARKLTSMVQQKQDGDLVPQIWTAVVLFLRYGPRQLEQWRFTATWFQVIEKCFNSSDHNIKVQAHSAWNRLVFALRLDENTSSGMIKMLSRVPLVQLKRKMPGKHAGEMRQVTFGSVCNLLYYALRPNSTPAQLNLYWDEYMVQLVGETLLAKDGVKSGSEEEDLTKVFDIVVAFLDTTPKPWINNRANENSTVKPDELPGIDPKWIRRNAQRVFEVMAPLIEKCFHDLQTWEDSIILVWSRFISSVAAAGVKEVKVSNDTMTSMACIFNLLYKLWDHRPQKLVATEYSYLTHFQHVFSHLVSTTIAKLGVLPFTEKLLSMGPQESFAIVATPSHSPFKARGEIKSPLHHLFTLMTRPAPEIRCDDVYFETVKSMLDPFFEARKTRRAQVELLKDLFQLLPHPFTECPASTVLWRLLAKYAINALSLKNTGSNSGSGSGGSDQPLGAEYRNIVKILELGITLSPGTPLSDWKELFAALVLQVTLESGESGRAISVIEPLARALHERRSTREQEQSLAYCATLLSVATYPKDRQALDSARRQLWGTSVTGAKSLSYDPYSYLYLYTRECLKISYKSVAAGASDNQVELLSAVADMVYRCPIVHATEFLISIQGGLTFWIADNDLKYRGRSSSVLATSVSQTDHVKLNLNTNCRRWRIFGRGFVPVLRTFLAQTKPPFNP
jgi:hypothetical protein